MTTKDLMRALLNQATALIDALPEDAPPPVTTPRPCTVNGPTGSVNIRKTPGTGTIITTANNGLALNVINSDTFNWSQIVGGAYDGDYIYTPYLSFS